MQNPYCISSQCQRSSCMSLPMCNIYNLVPLGLFALQLEVLDKLINSFLPRFEFNAKIQADLLTPPLPLPSPSARWGWHLFILWTLEKSWVIGGVHLKGVLWRDGGRTTASTGQGIWVEKLAGIIGAVAEAWSVKVLMWSVQFLWCVTLHEQVHWHDACHLGISGRKGRPKVYLQFSC